MPDFLSKLARSTGEPKKIRRSNVSRIKAREQEAPEESKDSEAVGAQPSLSKEDLAPFFELLQRTGLFDAEFYLSAYPDVAGADVTPIEHYFFHGFQEGRRPNPIFDSLWYLAKYEDVRSAGMQPLLHYVRFGEREGRQPGPYFLPSWYRKAYGLPESENALAHYLRNRRGPFSPIPEFDAKYYLETYHDVATAGVDPFEHYQFHGYKEGRNPSNDFNTRFYVQRYLKGSFDQNPLIHYLEHRHEEGYYPVPPENEATIASEVKRFTKPGPFFENLQTASPSLNKRAKVLAYYLTQFHAIPENDKWWGTGFTEWTNIARGLPRFKNHFQPRIPRDLGFYNLTSLETMERQAALARSAGVFGFVFYYYWFNGKRLLERPLNQFLASKVDMPFCLMWANENWTRRWDGMESEVLISQDYLASDDQRMLGEFARHFEDPRYIRVAGRPLLMIYRPRLIPDTAQVISRWRRIFQDRFQEDPIIVMSQSFDDFDPRVFGLDGAIEFPPHKLTKFIPQVNSEVQYLDDTFSGQIYKYEDLVDYSLTEETPPFPLIKTVVPSWDNDARRQGTGLVVHGSTPDKYEAWLSAVIDRAQSNTFFGEPIVCINAWNEWCEAAYLESDLHFGSAYLNATSRAVTGRTRNALTPRLLLVGHDAFPSGAQHLLLNIGQTLQSSFGIEIEFLLLAGGKLEQEYASTAKLTVVKDRKSLASHIRDLRDRGFSGAIVNTSASGDAVPILKENGIGSVLLIHELPRLLREKSIESLGRAGIKNARKVVFASSYVRDKITKALDIGPSDKFVIRPQGSYKQIVPLPAQAASIRKELQIAPDDHLVLGVGYADMRKGFDLFLHVWNLTRSWRPRIHFCWVGGIDPGLQAWLADEIREAEKSKTFHMVGYRDDVEAFFSAANAYLLTSREDPFPTVALEAMGVGVPVIAFEDTGGIPEFLKEKSIGIVVPYCDTLAMAMQLGNVLRGNVSEMRERAAKTIEGEFEFTPYVWDLVQLALPSIAAISVAVPNYNYAHCLAARLHTIFDQTYPVAEIIVLDDASSDSSVDVIQEVAQERLRDLTLVINDENSGSVFAQWAKAAEMAKGEFIWIAEADDLSEPAFLSSMLSLMQSDPDIEFGFSDSKSIDADGTPVYSSYKPYYSSIEPDALSKTEVFTGAEFVTRFLSVKNTILNVSSVLWRRPALLRALRECREDLREYRMAGDWRIYLEALSQPNAKIAYVADPLNIHRRHAQSVTHSLKAQKHVDEIKRIHEVVGARFGIPKAVQQAQKDYVIEVTEQLTGGSLSAARSGEGAGPSKRRASRQKK